MKTMCVGRFLLDIPLEFQFSYGDTRLYGAQIYSGVSDGPEDFSKIIREREAELLELTNENGQRSLETVQVIETTHSRGKLFVFDRQKSYHFAYGKRIDREWFSIEALVRVEATNYRLFVEIANAEKIAMVMGIIQNLRYRDSDEIPEGPGFCFANGIVLDPIPTPEPVESTVLFTGHPSYPDLAIVLNSMSGVTRQKNLLQRSAESTVRRNNPSAFRSIFEGRRSINGVSGEESSETVRERSGTRGHTYMWESDSVESDVTKPFLALELTTGIGRPGEPVNSSLSDKEVQALWEQISNSLRLRPTALPASKTEPVKLSPKSASAGTPCPQAGWWSCAEHADGHEVLGGTTQYFAQGVLMPEAELLGPRKIFGRRAEFRLATPTVWKFSKERT